MFIKYEFYSNCVYFSCSWAWRCRRRGGRGARGLESPGGRRPGPTRRRREGGESQIRRPEWETIHWGVSRFRLLSMSNGLVPFVAVICPKSQFVSMFGKLCVCMRHVGLWGWAEIEDVTESECQQSGRSMNNNHVNTSEMCSVLSFLVKKTKTHIIIKPNLPPALLDQSTFPWSGNSVSP